ncbi:variable charge X-linked protein 3B-like [Spodoptera litura]|uniref:Variable charge X-linked protein 3B-like n=1 Tax=Spodoptera litura TaxID=69820 RepID=A0A9J7IQE8_SPOLT|nr:variable charge X-linked protein 3B-like [Spodoptera litura]
MEGPSPSKRRKIGDEAREMIAKVYRFLKDEYEFTDLHKEPNADITHLRNITQRTAEATGVSERTVYKILREEREKLKGKLATAGSSQTIEPMPLKVDLSEESDVDAGVNESTESEVPEDGNVVATTSKEMEQKLIKKEKDVAVETPGVSGRTERILVIKMGHDTSEESTQKVIKEEKYLSQESNVPIKLERSSEDRVLPPSTGEIHIKEEKEERSSSEESDLPPLTEEIDIKEGSTSDESDLPPLTEETEIKEEGDLSEERDLPPSTEDVKEETSTSAESTTAEEKDTSDDSNTSEERDTSEEGSNTSEESKTSSEESHVNANGESEGLGINGIKEESDTREESGDIRRRYRDWS